MAAAPHPGFRLGIFVFKDAEILDFGAPYGVFSVARRFDPALDVFFVASVSTCSSGPASAKRSSKTWRA